eukprot:30728_1
MCVCVCAHDVVKALLIGILAATKRNSHCLQIVPYSSMRPAISVGLKLQVYAALSYCMRPATSVGLKLLVHKALSQFVASRLEHLYYLVYNTGIIYWKILDAPTVCI